MIRELSRQQGAWANIPTKRTRKDPTCFSPHLCRARNLIERFFNKIKQCRRIAIRYDKLAVNYPIFIKLASIRIWLRADGGPRHNISRCFWPLATSADCPHCFRQNGIGSAFVRNLSLDSRVRLRTLEVTMPFSMTTYFAGVGTVVGALALGFGGGIVLTNTAMKDTPAGQTRLERVARREPIAAPPQVVEAKAIPLLAADSAPAIKPVSAIQPQPVVAEVPKETHYVKEVELPRQPELTKQAEQKETEQRRATERRIDRHKRYAERKAREVATTRMKRRQFEEQGEPAKAELAYDRVEEPHFNLFESRNAPLRDRPDDWAPVYRRD